MSKLSFVYFKEYKKFGVMKEEDFIPCFITLDGSEFRLKKHIEKYAMFDAAKALKVYDQHVDNEEEREIMTPNNYQKVTREVVVEYSRKHQPWKFWVK